MNTKELAEAIVHELIFEFNIDLSGRATKAIGVVGSVLEDYSQRVDPEKIKKERTFDPRKPELETPFANCEPIGAHCDKCVLQDTCEYGQTIFPLIKRFKS